MAVSDYSTVADENGRISGINIAEGCPPSGINNAIRQLMADVKKKFDSVDAAKPNSHASTATTYGVGSATNYGHVKLSDTESSTNDATKGVAATPKALKTVSDALGTRIDAAKTQADKGVSDAAAKLPLEGGTMTGPIVYNRNGVTFVRRSDNTSGLGLSGGDNLTNSASTTTGANLILNGKDRASDGLPGASEGAGAFSLRASDGVAFKKLTGKPDGSLKWDGNDVLTTASGKAVSAGTADNLGTDTKGGAKQPIYLKSGVPTACTALKAAAYVDVCTTKATTTSSASVSNVAVVVTNYVSGNSWYRVWSDGWIEQGGIVTNTASAVEKTVTLKKAFTTTTYTLILQYHGATNGSAGEGANNIVGTRTTTTFKARLDNRDGIYYACGY